MYAPVSNYERYGKHKNPYKYYCRVKAVHDIGGQIIPVLFQLEGRSDWVQVHVLFNEQKVAKYAGGQGIAYRVKYVGADKLDHEYDLFHDADDWYIDVAPE